MPDFFRTLILPSSDALLARQIAAAFGPGGQGMWTTPLSADGQEPATHYISSGYISEGIATSIVEQIASADVSEEEPFVAMERMGLVMVNPPADL